MWGEGHKDQVLLILVSGMACRTFRPFHFSPESTLFPLLPEWKTDAKLVVSQAE